MRIGDSKLIEHAPSIYQETGGTRRTIAGAWRLDSAHQAGFRVASYDRTKPLVIDPVLIYSTYLGGSGVSQGDGLGGVGDLGGLDFVDSSGNMYLSGNTYSADFPTTSGAFQTANHAAAVSSNNIFVTKLNADGSALLYSTYLGGSGISQ